MYINIFRALRIYKNIPNIITIVGLIIVNYSLCMYNLTKNGIYLLYMIIGFCCDYLDGYYAKKLNLSSKLGNILDKIVDKINHTAIFITIISQYKQSRWYLILFFIREIIMYLLRKLKLKQSTSSPHGKLKTFIFPLSLLFFHKNIIFSKIYLKLWSVYNYLTILY